MTDRQTRLIEKAERALDTSRLALDDGDAEGAINRACYACSYVAQTLLLVYGEEPRTHRGVHHRFRERAVLTGLVPAELGRTLPYAGGLRARADSEAVAVTDAAADLLADARTFVDAVLAVLGGR